LEKDRLGLSNLKGQSRIMLEVHSTCSGSERGARDGGAASSKYVSWRRGGWGGNSFISAAQRQVRQWLKKGPGSQVPEEYPVLSAGRSPQKGAPT
jgi:hypothetical protein